MTNKLKQEEIIELLNNAYIFLKNKAKSIDDLQLTERDIEAFCDIAEICDEASKMLKRQKE